MESKYTISITCISPSELTINLSDMEEDLKSTRKFITHLKLIVEDHRNIFLSPLNHDCIVVTKLIQPFKLRWRVNTGYQ